jgi:hypothetical protein
MPEIIIREEGTGARTRSLKNVGGMLRVYNPAAGAEVMNIEAHAARHSRGGADPINFGTALALFLKSASPTLGTSGTLGAASVISPDSGYYAVVPLGISITVGGTLAAGETITVKITFNLDNNTTTSITKQYTATGTDYLTDADFFSLWANGVHITSISVQAASSAATTSATVTVTVRGIQH